MAEMGPTARDRVLGNPDLILMIFSYLNPRSDNDDENEDDEDDDDDHDHNNDLLTVRLVSR